MAVLYFGALFLNFFLGKQLNQNGIVDTRHYITTAEDLIYFGSEH